MILHWAQLVLHYGAELDAHRSKFEAAGQTTYGLLCCRAAPAGDRLSYSAGAHAEERLLATELWRAQVPAAKGARLESTPRPSRPCTGIG